MSAPYWASDHEDVVLHLGDCLDVLRTMEADSVDAIVTDPPAGIAFMGRDWDDFCRARSRFVDMLTERMAEAYRVLKPGGHALVWAIPRTSHWTAWAIEDAGFDLRDCVLHLFGSGFPKSLDVGKAIDKAAGAEREIVGQAPRLGGPRDSRPVDYTQSQDVAYRFGDDRSITAPATEDAARWSGWGTALKPGQEMWWLARKPLKGTVAANVLEFGTGALNIAACLTAHASAVDLATSQSKNPGRDDKVTSGTYGGGRPQQSVNSAGRWPANIVFTHSAACEPLGVREIRSDGHHPATRGAGGLGTSGHGGQDGLAERKSGTEAITAWACAPDCPVGELDRQSGMSVSRSGGWTDKRAAGIMGRTAEGRRDRTGHDDTGGASRFYPTFRYQAKAPASERPRLDDGTAHETVKSLGLMTWMVKLITPPGGTVLDMFAGSGPVGEVCVIEGFRCVLIEQNPKSAELIKTRLAKPIQPAMFGLEAS